MKRQRITVDLDESVVAAIDRAAGELATSRNRLIAHGVGRLLWELERERVDAMFARMADDPSYSTELDQIEREMSPASDAVWMRLDAAESDRSVERRPGRPGSKRAAR